MPEKKATTFFSYARADSEFVLKLVTDLRAAGASVWLDQLDIAPGELWDRAIEEALHSCPIQVVVLSPEAVNSVNVMDEVSFALEQRKKIIPVLHRECQTPFRLRRAQHVDFRTDYADGLKRLLRALGVDQLPQISRPATDYEPVLVTEPILPSISPPIKSDIPKIEPATTSDDVGQKQPRVVPAVRGLFSIRPIGVRVALVTAGLILLLTLWRGLHLPRSDERSDGQVAGEVAAKISSDSMLGGRQIVINAKKGVVTLTGSVNSDAERTAAMNDAAQVEGVKQVFNNLEVSPPPHKQ